MSLKFDTDPSKLKDGGLYWIHVSSLEGWVSDPFTWQADEKRFYDEEYGDFYLEPVKVILYTGKIGVREDYIDKWIYIPGPMEIEE